jgi:hypothetical protein
MQLSDLMLDIGDASGLEKMVNEWGSERDAAAWQHGAMEICALVRERPGNKSARFWRAWCTGLTRLPAQEFYERLSANSGTLIPLLASAEPIDNARPLRRLSGMLVDAWSSQGEPGTPGKQPGTPPALRELLQASLAGRDAAQGNFANLDAVPENLRHHAELEALTRLATHPKEMVDFVLTRATTFTLEDSEAAPMAGIGMTALPGYEDRIASVLAAPPSAARDLLLSYSVKARFHGTNVDLPALAAAITDDTLRASMQAAADGRFVWRSYREPR